MISISQALEQIISDSPFLEDGMYNGYINFSSFASYIQPRIERITKKKVTVSSIKMGLTKYSQDKQKSITYKKFSIEDFYIKKHIKIIYMDKNSTTLEYIKNIHSEELSKENYLAIISGGREIGVIYDEKLSHIIEENIDSQSRKVELTGLSVIGIYMDENCINESGIIYTLSKKLNFNNINIVEIISNYTEIAFVVEQKNLKKSLEVLMM